MIRCFKRHAGLIGLALITVAVMFGIAPVDREWSGILRAHKWQALVDFMGQTLFEGDPPGANDPVMIYIIWVVGTYFLIAARPGLKKIATWRPQIGFMLTSALFCAVYLVHGLKWIVGRARPGLVLGHDFPFTPWYAFGPHYISEGIYRGSFPSGHTAEAFILMAIAYALANDPLAKRPVRLLGWGIGALVLIFTLTMAVARCMASSHWLSDVLGSILFGWLIMHWLYFYILRVPEQRRYRIDHGSAPLLPRLWELVLSVYFFLAVLGVVLFVLGGRSLLIFRLSWYLLLVPVGLWLVWIAVGRIFRLLNLLARQLDQA